MTDPHPAPTAGVDETDAETQRLPDPDGETGRKGGSDTEGLDGLKDLT